MFLESIFPLDQSNTIMAFNTHIFIMKYKKKKNIRAKYKNTLVKVVVAGTAH